MTGLLLPFDEILLDTMQAARDRTGSAHERIGSARARLKLTPMCLRPYGCAAVYAIRRPPKSFNCETGRRSIPRKPRNPRP